MRSSSIAGISASEMWHMYHTKRRLKALSASTRTPQPLGSQLWRSPAVTAEGDLKEDEVHTRGAGARLAAAEKVWECVLQRAALSRLGCRFHKRSRRRRNIRRLFFTKMLFFFQMMLSIHCLNSSFEKHCGILLIAVLRLWPGLHLKTRTDSNTWANYPECKTSRPRNCVDRGILFPNISCWPFAKLMNKIKEVYKKRLKRKGLVSCNAM